MQSRWSRVLPTAVAVLSISACAAFAQGEPRTLVRWDFAQDTEGWYAEHSMAPLAATDGVLRGEVTGDDPYMICSRGQSFDIPGGDYQAIVIRAKVKDGGGAEFFWASSTEGKDLGFAAGKEIAFNLVADGQFHTYHVFPLWKDRVTRLRFDPPGGPSTLRPAQGRPEQRRGATSSGPPQGAGGPSRAESRGGEGQQVWIDYIAIVEFPRPAALPTEPVWNFERGLEGWLPQSDVESYETREGKLVITSLAGQRPSLLSPELKGDPAALRYLTIRAALEGVEGIIVSFAEDDARFDPRRQIIVPAVADGQARTYLVETAQALGGAQKIARVRLSFVTSRIAATINLDSVALAAKPAGPPQLELQVIPQNPVLFADQPRQFNLTVRNVGGEPVGPIEVAITSPAVGRTQLMVAGPASLAPGEKWTGIASVTPLFPGKAPLRVRASAPPAPPVDSESNLLVSPPINLSRLPHHPDGHAIETEGTVWLSNDVVGIAIARNDQGCGPALLCAWDNGWKAMATIPWPGEIVGAGTDATTVLLRPTPVFPLEALPGHTGAFQGIELRQKVASGEAVGDAKVYIRVTTGRPDIEVTAIFMPGQAGRLLRFAGPKLLAGDGAFDGEQAEGLFPGLEWLVRGEKSSGTLDIAPPGNVRFAPHPNRITVPLMAITEPGAFYPVMDLDGMAAYFTGLGAPVIGIAWDPMQKWDGEHDRPAAVFASPNFLDDQDNHLMQLFVPSVPEWTDENHLLADRPYDLVPGKPLTIKQRIFALPSGSVRDAVRLWYDRYGTPPLPDLPRSYEDDIALSIRSYEEVLYVKDKGWMGVLGWAPGASPQVALHYLLAAQVLGGKAPYPDLEQKARDRIGSNRDLALAAHIGGIAGPLLDLRARAYSAMSSQDEAGGWYFHPDEEHRPLGEPGQTTLGTVAGNAAILLRAARIFHDQRLLAAGLKGLAFMERFNVPRGAQVWEVPLHTPDILAAAQGVDACLAGYLATGDEQHLRRAVYWAEAGLPFLYAWQAPEKGLEAMRYGSIPVFGATWYVGSWFGRIVQWNGLAFAASLQRLADYDSSYDWRHIAEGVTRSGIIQQRLEPKYLGLYPDSVGMIDGSVSWGLMLGPQGLLDNVFPLIGRNLDPHVETVDLNGEPVTVICAGDLDVAEAGDDYVTLSLGYPAGDWMYATVVGVSDPRQVLVNGSPIERVTHLDVGAGYIYEPSLGIVEIRLPQSATPVPIVVAGVKAFGGEGARTAWDFESGAQGWHAMHSLSPIEVKGGIAVTSITGEDPFMGVIGLDASTADFGGVRIRMRAGRSGPAEVFFAAGGQPFVADSQQAFAVEGGALRDYVIDLRSHSLWRGTVTALRVDPPGAVGDVIELDAVALIPRSEMP